MAVGVARIDVLINGFIGTVEAPAQKKILLRLVLCAHAVQRTGCALIDV